MKLSTGPDVLAPAGAANVVCKAAQLVSPAATQVATPAGPTSRFVPEIEPMFVATSAPIGAPAQPGTDDPAVQTFGLCMVSLPRSVKFSPVKEASPVETGNGRPDCRVLSMPNVQLFRMVRTTGVCEEVVRVRHEVEVDQVADIILSGSIVQTKRRKWIPRFRKAEEVLSVRQSMGPYIAALELDMVRHPLYCRDHQCVVPRLAIAEDRPDRAKGWIGNARHIEIAGMGGVCDRRREVGILFAEQAVCKYALVPDAIGEGGSQLPLVHQRRHVHLRVLKCWRYGADPSVVSHRLEKVQ